MKLEEFEQDLIKLNLDFAGLKCRARNFEGTRHFFQYENDDYSFSVSKIFKPKISCYGVTNRCEDGKFVLFLDYDKIYKDIVFQNLNNLLVRFPNTFSNFFIATSGEPEEILSDGNLKCSYHVVCLSKFFMPEIVSFLQVCDVDPHFIEIPKKTAHKCHVLRVSEKVWRVSGQEVKRKPKFLGIYPKTFLEGRGKISYAHYSVFLKEWGLVDPFWNKRTFDSFKQAEIHSYSTAKAVEK